MNFDYFTTAVDSFGTLISRTIPVLIALAVLLFIWGVVRFISASGYEKAADEGKQRMIWGVIALFVIVSVWGLVALVREITGTNNSAYIPQAPHSAF